MANFVTDFKQLQIRGIITLHLKFTYYLALYEWYLSCWKIIILTTGIRQIEIACANLTGHAIRFAGWLPSRRYLQNSTIRKLFKHVKKSLTRTREFGHFHAK
jgi:hypothetical protein